MNPPLKKLAVIFLIGSILTSSFALGVSAIFDRAPVKYAAPQQGNASGGANDYKIYGAGPNGQNLTDEVTSIFARQLVEANPQGPQQNQDGSVQLFSPTSTEMLSYLDTNTPSESILTPPIDDSKIQVIQNFDASDVSGYLVALTQIQNDITSSPVWQVGLSVTTTDVAASMNWASETAKIFVAARDDAYAIKVPAPLVPLHKSELASFSTAASFLDIVVQDPVAAMSLSKNLDKIVANQIADTERAVKDIQTNYPALLSLLPQGDGSVLTKILGIQIAYAQFVTIDPAHIGATLISWAQEFWKQYKQVIISNALGVLKNRLMQKIGEKIVKWAEGEGIPGYVTNWVMFQASAAWDAKVGLISKEAARACGNAATVGVYGDILASALGVSTYQAGTTGVDQTVGETPGCPSISSGFYNKGGYSAENFLQSLTYNTYNDLLNLKDRSMRAAAAASQAAVNEAISGRGLLDVKKCDDGSTPSSTQGNCADGGPAQTITPGSAKQELISKSLSGAQDIIAGVNNENTYGAIVQLLTNALVTYVTKKGEGVFSNSSNRPGGTPPPAPDTSLRDKLTWYSDQLETALALAQGAVANSEQAIQTFQQILSGGKCAESLAGQIQTSMATLTQALVTLKERVQEIQRLLDAVNALKQNPNATQAQLDAIASSAGITALVTRSQGDNNTAATALNAANELFTSPECQP